MNYAELKQRKEQLKQERSRLESEIAALNEQKRAAEQEFLAGLAVVKVGDRVLYRDEEYEVIGYSGFLLCVAESYAERGQDPNTPDVVAYNCCKVLAKGKLAKKAIELPASSFKVVSAVEVKP